jgi:hypothetical protein
VNTLFTKSLLVVLAFDAITTLTIITLYGYGSQLWLVAIPLFLGLWLMKKARVAIDLLTSDPTLASGTSPAGHEPRHR